MPVQKLARNAARALALGGALIVMGVLVWRAQQRAQVGVSPAVDSPTTSAAASNSLVSTELLEAPDAITQKRAVADPAWDADPSRTSFLPSSKSLAPYGIDFGDGSFEVTDDASLEALKLPPFLPSSKFGVLDLRGETDQRPPAPNADAPGAKSEATRLPPKQP